MKQQINLMTGQEAVFADQLHAQARNEGQKVTASILAAAAICIGSTVTPGLLAPRAISTTLATIEIPAFVPSQRSQRGITRNYPTPPTNRHR